jgi:hypothetical protein
MATLEDLNARLQGLQERQSGIDNSTRTIIPENGVTDITEAVNTTADAVSAANTSKNLAASAASSAAGYANVAKTARDAAADSASAASDYATRADASKSAAATSATNATTAATNATAAKTAAETAKTDTLTAYEGALEAYAGSIDVLADVEAIRANTVEAWQNIQNSIYTPAEVYISDEGVLAWADPETHKIYYNAGMPVTNLTVSFTDDYYTDSVADIRYITELHFISHSTIQSSYSNDLIYWSGNDCANGKFVPAGNRVYDIVLASNMERLRGYVSGTPTLASTMALRPTRGEDPVAWVLYINDTTVQYAPKYVVIDGTVYTNPDASRLIEAGYKPLLVDERPEDEEGYYITSSYEDTEEAVLQHWAKIPVVVPEEPTVESPVEAPADIPVEEPEAAPAEEPDAAPEEMPEEV